MIPNNKMSTTPVYGSFLTPRRLNKLHDYEFGGVDIRNTSQGLSSYLWECYYEDDKIIIKNDEVTHELLSVPDVEYLSFSFDQNLNPNVVYVNSNNESYLYWYDSSLAEQVTTYIGDNLVTPNLSFDDKREQFISSSDIILAYLKEGSLYYRQQRDRYTVEYFVSDVGNGIVIEQIGLTNQLRFQFYCR